MSVTLRERPVSIDFLVHRCFGKNPLHQRKAIINFIMLLYIFCTISVLLPELYFCTVTVVLNLLASNWHHNLFIKASWWELQWSLLVSSARSQSKNLTQFSAVKHVLFCWIYPCMMNLNLIYMYRLLCTTCNDWDLFPYVMTNQIDHCKGITMRGTKFSVVLDTEFCPGFTCTFTSGLYHPLYSKIISPP